MPRHARYTLSGIPQYVVQKGHNGESIFIDENDYRFYLDCLYDASVHCNCEIHAYTLLHNYVHLLITQHTPNGIAQLFQSLGRRYVRYFNDLRGRSGTLWEGRYKSCLIESEQYLMPCQRYIELYPVRKGLAKAPEDYPWSSASSYVNGAQDRLITIHSTCFDYLDCDHEHHLSYKNFLKKGVAKQEEKLIKESVNKSGILGRDAFLFEVEKQLGWRVKPGKPGRPRRDFTNRTT